MADTPEVVSSRTIRSRRENAFHVNCRSRLATCHLVRGGDCSYSRDRDPSRWRRRGIFDLGCIRCGYREWHHDDFASPWTRSDWCWLRTAHGYFRAFIAVSITAIAEGGPAMLATLIVCSAICQYALAARLSFFRRVLTPAVAGTVIMLIPVSVAPIIFDMLEQVPEGSSTYAAPVSALVTMVVIGAIALTMKGVLRLWAPVIGVIVGSVTSLFYGIYDVQEIASAAWFGIPSGGWPGLDLSFGPVFWSLLPAFIFVTLIGAIETIGDSVAIQRVSWRKPRAIDYRAVQGAVAADGTGNLLSGLIGTLPNTTYSSSISVTELTGVANRNIGIAIGVIFIVLAFFPKALAVILAIPGPVACAYVMILLAMLFVVGMRIVVGDGLDYRKSLVVGVSFWIGVGCQNGVIFPRDLAGVCRWTTAKRYDYGRLGGDRTPCSWCGLQHQRLRGW